jgi:phosphate transport system permease protein
VKRPTALDTELALGRGRGLLGRVAGEVNLGDRIFRIVTALFAVSIIAVLAGMTMEMVSQAMPTLRRFGLSFIVGTNWDPVREDFGALPYIYGTVVSSLLALALAVPVALGIAIFLSELAPLWIRRPLGFMVELLAAIPSVVYGLWGVFVLAPWMRDTVQPLLKKTLGFLPSFQGPANGFGMLTAALILAIMILPTIASISRDVLGAAPAVLREGALALGATRWEAIRRAVLPYVRSGLVGAIILGLGRALGETMAATMVIGNRGEISGSLFKPAATMASVIANEYTEASNDVHLAALSEIALLLFGVTLLLNIAARLLVWRVGRLPGGVGRL